MSTQQEQNQIRSQRIEAAQERLEQIMRKTRAKVFFAWLTDEHYHHNRGMWWYIITSLVTVFLLVYAFIDENFLFAIIIVLGAAAVFFGHRQGNSIVSVIFTDEGLYYNEKLIPYSSMRSFYIIYEPPIVKDLYIDFFMLRPRLRIDLEDMDPVAVRGFLLDVVKEDREKDDVPFSEVIARLLKL